MQKGFLRELLGLPPHFRNVAAATLNGYTCFTWDTCNKVFRDAETYTSVIYHSGPTEEQSLGLLEMDGLVHRGFRMTIQPMFIKPRTLTWWRQRWINDIVESLIDSLRKKGSGRASNLQLCARVPVHTVTRAIGMDGGQTPGLPSRPGEERALALAG